MSMRARLLIVVGSLLVVWSLTGCDPERIELIKPPCPLQAPEACLRDPVSMSFDYGLNHLCEINCSESPASDYEIEAYRWQFLKFPVDHTLILPPDATPERTHDISGDWTDQDCPTLYLPLSGQYRIQLAVRARSLDPERRDLVAVESCDPDTLDIELFTDADLRFELSWDRTDVQVDLLLARYREGGMLGAPGFEYDQTADPVACTDSDDCGESHCTAGPQGDRYCTYHTAEQRADSCWRSNPEPAWLNAVRHEQLAPPVQFITIPKILEPARYRAAIWVRPKSGALISSLEPVQLTLLPLRGGVPVNNVGELSIQVISGWSMWWAIEVEVDPDPGRDRWNIFNVGQGRDPVLACDWENPGYVGNLPIEDPWSVCLTTIWD